MSRVCFGVTVSLALASTATAQPIPALQPAPGRPADPALAPVPTDAFGFVSVKASRLWDLPAAKPLRDWAAAQKEPGPDTLIGLSPADIDRVTIFMPTLARDEAAPVLLVTTRQPYNEAKVLKALGVGERAGRRGRFTGRVAEIDGPFRHAVFADDRTMVFLPDRLGEEAGPLLLAQLIARKPDGPLAAALIDAQLHDVAIGLDVRSLAAAFDERDGKVRELAPYLALLRAKTATLTADFDRTAKVRLTMAFPDADSAKRAAPVLEEGMKTISEFIEEEQKRKREDPTWLAMAGWGVGVMKAAKVTVDGANVVATADVPYADEFARFVAVLPKSIGVARANAKATNNLKQLALAFHNFESTNAFFPSDVAFGDKNPAMSWRVQILPYIEQDNAYRQLDATKAWDDAANLKVLEAMEMPKVFEVPGRPAPKGHTYFRVFSYPKGAKGNDRPIFDEARRGVRFADITDGSSNTFLIVEAGEAVPWYKPDVLAYDGKLPLPQLGDKTADLFLVAMADGSVRSLRPSKVGEQTLRALITRAGGEPVALPDR